MPINWRFLATQVGESVKYSSSLNAIDRAGRAAIQLPRREFPNDAITSTRAQLVYDWILTLEAAALGNDEKERRLHQFCGAIVERNQRAALDEMLRESGFGLIDEAGAGNRINFEGRNFQVK